MVVDQSRIEPFQLNNPKVEIENCIVKLNKFGNEVKSLAEEKGTYSNSIIIASLTPNLQEQHENLDASSIITNLKKLFQKRARHERYEVSKALYRCRMAEGVIVGPHVVKMVGYIQRLETLGFIMDAELSIDLVWQSLPDSFS
ncbi:uncharacterized protein LOC116117888 [Pistacia vera]|uniref:uncharacterized protein LOC116117888 n=1 Tax=Pistacia vera TaxID=55513 RepID=UPI0012632C0A|nr:uncharacterized protein LOC116117888 [Pistacia vera]